MIHNTHDDQLRRAESRAGSSGWLQNVQWQWQRKELGGENAEGLHEGGVVGELQVGEPLGGCKRLLCDWISQ
jgi:hypothetical protein